MRSRGRGDDGVPRSRGPSGPGATASPPDPGGAPGRRRDAGAAVRPEPDDDSLDGAICLVHEHPPGARPPWLDDLAAVCRVIEVHPSDLPKLGRFRSLPWLIDVRRLDARSIAELGLNVDRASGSVRLLAVNRDDLAAPARAVALGATDVVVRPIRAKSIVERILGLRSTVRHASTRRGRTSGTATTEDDAPADIGRIASSIARVADVLDRFARRTNRMPLGPGEWPAMIADVVTVLEKHGLEDVLESVRQHHAGTHQHSLLVMAIGVALGRSLGLARSDIELLALGGLLHDVGKCTVPESILSKPGRLTDAEFQEIRRHPMEGLRLLAALEPALPAALLDMVRHHHERLDGTGYPDGLRGLEIAPMIRWLSICDVYGALVERRSYRPPLAPSAALAIVRAMAEDGKVDPEGVAVLAGLVSDRRRAVHRSNTPE